VWLATDMSLSRQVAVKVLKSTLAADPVVAERFRREVITVARLSHPNIVAVHDTIDYDGRQAVVMQLVNGKSLRQLLDEQKRLGPELTMHIGSCVASALDAAHGAGLVHRDVKPGNILITPDGRVLLTDFGIAKGPGTTEDLTSENVMMGTAKYLSPEQVRGKKLDGRADLYALGLVLYECLAGRVPFLGETDADTALARLQRDPTDLARLRPTLPYGLAALIHELLARNPDDRPATGGDLRTRLARIASGVDDPTTTLTPPSGTTAPQRVAPRPPTKPTDATPTRQTTSQGLIRPPTPGRANTPGDVAPRDPVRQSTPRDGTPRPIKAPPPKRDRTPTGGVPRGVPARRFEERRTPTVVVIVLLCVAAIVAAILLSKGNSSGGPGATETTPAGSSPSLSTTAQPAGPVSIASIASWDPGDPNGGTERPDDVDNAIDANPDTVWRTSCYNDQYFNGKPGVGLAIELSAPAAGTLDVTLANAPYQMNVYASSADAMPTSTQAWGSPVQPKRFSESPGTVSVSIDKPARFILVSLLQAARDAGCTAKFPFRGSISEIAFSPA